MAPVYLLQNLIIWLWSPCHHVSRQIWNGKIFSQSSPEIPRERRRAGAKWSRTFWNRLYRISTFFANLSPPCILLTSWISIYYSILFPQMNHTEWLFFCLAEPFFYNNCIRERSYFLTSFCICLPTFHAWKVCIISKMFFHNFLFGLRVLNISGICLMFAWFSSQLF